MENIFGNKAVSGKNFFGRRNIVKLLVGILISHNSFLLLGLRRIGKSSVMAEAVRRIKESKKDLVVIEMNCLTYKSIEDFYKNLYLALPFSWRKLMRISLKESKRIPIRLIDFITDHMEEVQVPLVGGFKLRNDVIAYQNPLKEEITKFFKEQKKHIILCIDELPFLFESISKSDSPSQIIEIESILNTLRSWRDIGISQGICGSLNLHLQLQQFRISRKLLAGVNSEQLPKFTRDEAYGLIEALSNSSKTKLNHAEIEEMISLIPDHIPQFLQYFFFIANTYYESGVSKLKDLFEEHVYPNIVKDFEYQFEDRFAKLSETERDVAKQILNLVNSKKIVRQSEILKQIGHNKVYEVLLKMLDLEFLVINSKQECSFSFEILRNWWNKINL